MKKLNAIIMVLAIVMVITSCNNTNKDVPSGYVAKKLTPSGVDDKIYEAGQVDIGTVDNDGEATSLVILEATTVTIKEQFMKADTSDGQDHRVKTRDNTPLYVDMYIQVSIPTDDKTRNSIFATVTPTATTDPRIYKITAQNIYDKYAKMIIRGNVRTIFSKYENNDSVMDNFAVINASISKMIIEVVKQSKAPFEVMSAQLSNVQEDPVILASKTKLIAADNEVAAIKKVGEAIRLNPYYLEARRLDVLESIGEQSKSNLIVMDSKGSTVLALPAPTATTTK
jgi:hypothetical protein